MENILQERGDSRSLVNFKRSRLNKLFTEAVKYPLVVVCAGAGYGKTSAVHDFAEEYQASTTWVQLSECDNTGARFWENYTHSMSQANTIMAKAMAKIGFPDTKEKLKQYQALLRDFSEIKKRIIVMDDFHCIEEPVVLDFIEKCILQYVPQDTSVFLISRAMPRIKTGNNIYHEQMFTISEDDLRFTEDELSQYFHSRDIPVTSEGLREMMQDTEGWAFGINFIVRSYQKAPGYGGYVRNAMKINIFNMMENEVWSVISEDLQNLFIRLSLINHLSVDLITLLAGDEILLNEFEKLNSCVRRDNFIDAYLIHPLFLEFMTAKQGLLSEDQKQKTYAIAGEWCSKNGFRTDALSYFEKTGDYQSILFILTGLTTQLPQDIAKYAAEILDRAPEDAFDKVDFLADIHLRTYICQGLLKKSFELAKRYEEKFLKLQDNLVKNRTLTRLYICQTYIRCLMSVTDDVFDYDTYIEKACKCIHKEDSGKLDIYYPGAWVNFAGSSRKGSPEEFIAAIARNHSHISQSYMKGYMAGELELAQGELEFYHGDTSLAASHIALAVKQARSEKQFGIMHRALFYILRIAAAQGNFIMTEQTLKEIKNLLDEAEYVNRFMDYDISLSWYYCFLDMPEKTVNWLKEDFAPYNHAAFIDNFSNQIKARYRYVSRNFSPLLLYIEEMKMRESFLFGRIEMLAIEACIHYKLKNKKKALAALQAAYEESSPNKIVMPFIELEKDMRTLTAAALNDSNKIIPSSWLEDINQKSSTYAKYHSHIIAEYMKTNGISKGIVLSPRESEILSDLSHGLSRSQIAAARGLSINTVKMVIKNIHYKLNVESLADLIRIAVEQKLI